MLAIWILFAKLTFVLCQSRVLNTQCQVARSGTAGVCRSLQDCPVVLDEMFNKGLSPTVCGYLNRQQIVCCPLPPKPKTSTTQSPEIASRISVQKCAEYQDAVYERVLPFASFFERPPEEKILRCPFSSVPLVVGGEDAQSREFPHMALIGFKRPQADNITWGCGGSLISDQWIITAAHCLYQGSYGNASHVLLGDLNYRSDEDDAQPQLFGIVQRVKNPNYRRQYKYDDIALIKINGSATFNQFVRPACLPTTESIPVGRVIATGWGKTDPAVQESTSSRLQKVILELFSHRECDEIFANARSRKFRQGVVEKTQVCAGSHTERKDTCQGDSGGPIQIYHSDLQCMYTIVGVTSFGKACATEGAPGIYTRVFAYLDWIESVVWEDSSAYVFDQAA